MARSLWKELPSLREFGWMLSRAWSDWNDENASGMAAALSYYTVLSIAPLLIVVMATVGLVFGREAARGEIMSQIQSMMGADAAQAIQTVITNADKPKAGTTATILGLVTVFLGATGVLSQLKASLNRIWDATPDPSSGAWGFVRERLLSFGMLLAIGFLLLVSLVVSAAVSAAGKYVGGMLPAPGGLLQLATFVVSLVVATALFAMIYRFLPDRHIAWTDVWIGAAFTALLFALGKFGIAVYLAHAGLGSSYGAAGSLVVVLAWVYYSALIFFFGAEFTHVYAVERGSLTGTSTNQVVTVPVHVSTPEEQRGLTPAHSFSPLRAVWLATIGGLGLWMSRSTKSRRSGE